MRAPSINVNRFTSSFFNTLCSVVLATRILVKCIQPNDRLGECLGLIFQVFRGWDTSVPYLVTHFLDRRLYYPKLCSTRKHYYKEKKQLWSLGMGHPLQKTFEKCSVAKKSSETPSITICRIIFS